MGQKVLSVTVGIEALVNYWETETLIKFCGKISGQIMWEQKLWTYSMGTEDLISKCEIDTLVTYCGDTNFDEMLCEDKNWRKTLVKYGWTETITSIKLV